MTRFSLPPKAEELLDEFRSVVGARQRALDWLLPTLLFAPVNAWLGLTWAAVAALAVALGLVIRRLWQGEPLRFALLGLGGVLVAVAIALISREAAGFFLPGIISSAATTLACLVSVMLGRPLVAWTSHLARGWPLEWYWHPRVRPAYTVVTLIWTLFFALRGMLQLAAYQGGRPLWLALLSIVGGWPATVVLLIISYLYGTWRLGRLGGPSVAEFRQNDPPPWQGQSRGF